MNEHQVRDHVHKLRRFYTDVLVYVVVNIGLILIWVVSGGGYFWPIWVIIGWGIGLGVHAFSLGLIPQMNAMVPFMTAEWEDQEVRRLMEAGYKGKEQAEKKAQKKAKMEVSDKIEAVPDKIETVPDKIETITNEVFKVKRVPPTGVLESRKKAAAAKKARAAAITEAIMNENEDEA